VIVLQGDRAAVVKLCFLPRTRLLAAGDENGTVVGWDLDTQQPAFTWTTDGVRVRTLAASPDGRRVYATRHAGRGTGCHAYHHETDTTAVIPDAYGLALNPAGTRLLTEWYDRPAKRFHLRCWKLYKTGDPVLAWTGPPAAFRFHFPVYFPDGKRFAASEETPRPNAVANGADLIVGDAATGTVRIRVPADEMDVVGDLLVHPDGTKVVAVVRPKLVVWDAATGKRVAEPANSDGNRHLTGAAFHPSGRRLLTSCNDAAVRVWDTATWRPAETFTWDVGKVKSVAYSPDGLLAAAGGDRGKIVVWDADG
jgi:WD40 repeat protein